MEVFHDVSNQKVVDLLVSGKVGVIPTDTIYGLVCVAANESAVQRLYSLKNREHKPGTLIAATIEQLVELGIKARYLKAVEQYWPNSISIELPVGFELPYLHLGTMRLAVRIPKDGDLQNLLKQTGALMTTSANHPGERPAGTIKEAVGYFGDKADFYVEGGDLSKREASTVIRMVDDAVEVIRQGAVQINEATGEIV